MYPHSHTLHVHPTSSFMDSILPMHACPTAALLHMGPCPRCPWVHAPRCHCPCSLLWAYAHAVDHQQPSCPCTAHAVRCPAAHSGPHGFWRVQWLKAASNRAGAVSNFRTATPMPPCCAVSLADGASLQAEGPGGSRQHWTQHWSKDQLRCPSGSGRCPARARNLRMAKFP
jgi:hypothetical protein